MYKLDLERAKEPDIKLPNQHPLDHRKSKEIPKKFYFCFIDYVKAFDCVDHNFRKFLRDGSTRPPYLSPEKSVCRIKNGRTRHGKITDWFKTGKGVC